MSRGKTRVFCRMAATSAKQVDYVSRSAPPARGPSWTKSEAFSERAVSAIPDHRYAGDSNLLRELAMLFRRRKSKFFSEIA
jgi:hypothetical protein